MSKGQKDMILMDCHAACIYFPTEIFIPCETLSLRELTVQVLLDLERYRILETMPFQGYLLSGKIRRVKVLSFLSTKRGSNFSKIT